MRCAVATTASRGQVLTCHTKSSPCHELSRLSQKPESASLPLPYRWTSLGQARGAGELGGCCECLADTHFHLLASSSASTAAYHAGSLLAGLSR